MACDAYLQRYKADPESCPDPETALAIHRAGRTSENRALERDARIRERFTDLDRMQTLHRRRWATPADILED